MCNAVRPRVSRASTVAPYLLNSFTNPGKSSVPPQAAISAGDSLAGYWPALDYVSGACNLTGNGQDQTCTITVFQDTDVIAVYYGGESPGLSHYTYPTCPTQRTNPPAWAARCP